MMFRTAYLPVIGVSGIRDELEETEYYENI
jgi:hypothetical protein